MKGIHTERQFWASVVLLAVVLASVTAAAAYVVSALMAPERVRDMLLVAFLFLLVLRLLLTIADKLFGWPAARYQRDEELRR